MVTFRAWALVVSLSLAIHLVATVGFQPQSIGEVQKAAGARTMVAGSLADILGTAVPVSDEAPETTDAEDPPDEIKPLEEVAELKPLAKPQPMDVLEARTQSADPVALEAQEDVKPLEEFRDLKVSDVPPKKREEAKPKKTTEKKKKKKKDKKASKKRKKSQQQVGGKKKGASGKSRGGKGGKKRASVGAVRSYGARVRARILANRPRGGAKGRVVVSFGISPSGGLRYARVRSGGGSAASAALSAVRRSAPFPRPPAGSQSSQLNFSIAFTFR